MTSMAPAHVSAGTAGDVMPTLILHFDVNETILVADPAGGDTLTDCLNKSVAKNAYVWEPSRETTPGVRHWCDGTVIGSESPVPPLVPDWKWPEGCMPYYRAYSEDKEELKCFTEPGRAGAAYRTVYNQMMTSLEWPEDSRASANGRLCREEGLHFLLPALFRTICELERQGRSFGVVIRTFGSDIEDVVEALNAFASGTHLSEFQTTTPFPTIDKHNVWDGKYSDTGNFTLTCRADGTLIEDEDVILDVMEGRLHGVHLVRVPTFAAILDQHWFLKQIAGCEENLRSKTQES
ncbi:hypothetical protein CYMTET_52115 [Cymbomonas tetramitiformis]|uniref:Uncharacterized protein n=1 Tax=Cymbomonas tetramitiformis TaxID=36881 RepID=A0AAE0ET26_9CHLO|nr:hypothetical protein CYMTET_52115 [Cymbomonas tetramitiformis]